MAEATTKKTKLFRKQPAIRRVLWALLPCQAGAVYFFGWRCLAVTVFACMVGLIAEWLFCRSRKEPMSEAVLVTAVLFALIMPPIVPWYVVGFGTLFAVVISKELFGGFGRNIFNPAMAGRCFVYICYPIALTAVWAPAAEGPLGALGRWDTIDSPQAITSTTPMADMKAQGEIPSVSGLFFGRISGTSGVTSALLILIGGVYLYVTQTANRTIINSAILAYVGWNTLLWLLKAPGFYGPHYAVLGGGFLFGAFFMATDPVSSPKTQTARIIYGIIIATGTTVIRNYSSFNGGLMFSILLGNMFGPILDHLVSEHKARLKEAHKAETAK